MLQILIIFGWIIACVLLVYLAVDAVKHRLIGQRRVKSTTEKDEGFNKQQDSDKSQHGTNLDRVVSPVIHHIDSHYYRRGITIMGYLALFLWEIFWFSEISDRFRWTANPFQLPYFFLLTVLVGVPLAVYLVSRRILRRSFPS